MKYGMDDIVPLWLDNEALAADPARAYPVVQAASGKIVHKYHSASTTESSQAAMSAGRAFQIWRRAGVAEKRKLLNTAADIMERNIEEYVQIECNETSGTTAWVTEDVHATVAVLREAAAVVSMIQGTIPQVDKPETTGFIFKQPVGTVVIIPPWNAAYVLAARALATAIAAGCTVVLKRSEVCPATHLALAKLFTKAGAIPGLVNLVVASRDDASACTEALFASKEVRKIDFIGSSAVGRILGAQASKYLKPITLELGGKCPALVLDDADLVSAAALCADGALRHHGQVCFSTERVIVQKGIAEPFLELLVKAFQDFGPVGCAVSTGVASHARELLLDASSHGCKFLIGGFDFAEGTTMTSLSPTIVLEPPREARIVDEETFGPSLSVYVVSDDHEAVDRANDSRYGLNATVHTKDLGRALRIADQLEYGQVHFNTSTLFVGPFASQGGVKGSGWGRQNSRWGVEEFLEEKFISWRDPGSVSAGQFH